MLVKSIIRIRDKYNVKVYLEPGEAVALNTGFLVTTVLDTLKNGMDLAIIDASAACHMPDVMEMPYRPQIIGAELPGVLPYTYRLGGNTCLARITSYNVCYTKLLRADKVAYYANKPADNQPRQVLCAYFRVLLLHFPYGKQKCGGNDAAQHCQSDRLHILKACRSRQIAEAPEADR